MAEAAGALHPHLRVLLVEDDASIRRFVALVLEDEPLQLAEAESLAEARAQLARGRFDVVIADLMLGDGSGMDLLQELGTDDHRGVTRIAFSAGIDRTVRARLEAIGVNELLAKPVSVNALLEAIARAAAARAGARGAAVTEPAGAAAAPSAGAPAGKPAGGAGADGRSADAVDRFFGGDAGLFALYRQQCLAQFEADLREGDTCAAAGDMASMRRLAHSLKSVLTMLGDERGGACARTLERTAAAGDAPSAVALWRDLAGLIEAQRAGR